MPKPVCVKCQRFFRPKKNGYEWMEMKPIGGVQVPQGTEAPEMWEPYKLWRSDLWECKGCGSQIIVGHCGSPLWQDYMSDPVEPIMRAASVVNDC